MRHEKTIGKPYAGNPHVRFERGDQEPGLARAPRLIPTNVSPGALLLADTVRRGHPQPPGHRLRRLDERAARHRPQYEGPARALRRPRPVLRGDAVRRREEGRPSLLLREL